MADETAFALQNFVGLHGMGQPRVIGHGGQADVFLVTSAMNEDSLTHANVLKSPLQFTQLVVRCDRLFEYAATAPENESDTARAKRLKKLREIAREINFCLHYACGYPFVDVIALYTAINGNNQKTLNFVMPYYAMSLWAHVGRVAQHEQAIGRRSALTEQMLRMIFTQILCGLERMHSQNTAHRDVTAANILLDFTSAGPRVYIADFGYSKSFREDYSENTQENDFQMDVNNNDAEDDDEGYVGFCVDEEEEALSTAFGNSLFIVHRHAEDVDGERGFNVDEEADALSTLVGPPSTQPASAYVSHGSAAGPYTCAGTIMFRSPESLLHDRHLDVQKVDVWAVGVNLLFAITRGCHGFACNANGSFKNQIEQLESIYRHISPFSQQPNAARLVHDLEADLGMKQQLTSRFEAVRHKSVFDLAILNPPHLSLECKAVLQAMLSLDPNRRPTATELLEFDWFNSDFSAGIKDDIRNQELPDREELYSFETLSEGELLEYVYGRAPTYAAN